MSGEEHEHVVVAADFALDGSLTGDEITGRARSLVADVAGSALSAGCHLIGHIKGLVFTKAADRPDTLHDKTSGGQLYVSLTSAQHGPVLQGSLGTAPERRCLTLAAIVYGLDHETLQALLLRCVARHFPGAERLR